MCIRGPEAPALKGGKEKMEAKREAPIPLKGKMEEIETSKMLNAQFSIPKLRDNVHVENR